MKRFINSLTVMSAILSLITVFSCDTPKVDSRAVIKGNIITNNSVVLLKELNPYVFNSDTIVLDGNGGFVFDVNIEKPTYYTLSIGRENLTLYVRPGDSVLFSGNAENLFSSVRFRGDAPVYNDYIIRSNKISEDFQRVVYKIFGLPEPMAVAAMDSLRGLHADELAALQKGNSNIDPLFLEMEKARILYEWAILHAIYPEYFNYINRGQTLQTSPEYSTYLAELSFEDESIIDMPLYLSFIDLYLRDDYNRYYEDTTQRANSSYTAHQLKLIDKVSDSEIIKSLLAYHVVSQQVDYEGYKDYDDYWSTFESICTNKALLDQLNDKLLNWNHLRRGSMAKDFIAENMDGDSLSLSAFKGKWIYVDVWASWCNPCIAEIPTLKALEEKMHENNIVFMSVSVDKTREPWRKMVVDKDLKGVQLWAGDNDVLKEFYRVTGIPRFMIIDPEGNIYESSAKRPSSNVEKVLLGLEGI